MSQPNPSEKPVEDFLRVDNPIPAQNFCCLSFISPEKLLKEKQVYFVHQFLREVAEKYDLDVDKIEEKYDDFIFSNQEKIEKEFYEKNDFQTTVRGLKVRGVFDTRREAEVRAKVLQQQDPNFHVFVGDVGKWLPWDPSADDVEDQQYAESHLNKLVQKYEENKKKRDTFYQQNKEESLQNIKEENRRQKEANGDVVANNDDKKDVAATEETPSTSTDTNEAASSQSTVPPAPPSNIEKALDDDDPWVKRKKEEGVLDLDADTE